MVHDEKDKNESRAYRGLLQVLLHASSSPYHTSNTGFQYLKKGELKAYFIICLDITDPAYHSMAIT